MGDNKDLSLVKIEGQLASFTFDLCKAAPALSRKAKRSIDVHRARRSLSRALEKLNINDGWHPLIVTPEAMPIRVLVDIIREADPSEARAAILRHILSHFGSEVSNVKGVRGIKGISFIEALKLFEGDPKNLFLPKLKNWGSLIEGSFGLTSTASHFTDEVSVCFALFCDKRSEISSGPCLQIEFLREETLLKVRKDTESFTKFFIKFARSFNFPRYIHASGKSGLDFLGSLQIENLCLEIDGRLFSKNGELRDMKFFDRTISIFPQQHHTAIAFFIKCVVRSWDTGDKFYPSNILHPDELDELGYLARQAVYEVEGGCPSVEYQIRFKRTIEYELPPPFGLSSSTFYNPKVGRLIKSLCFWLARVSSQCCSIQVVWQESNPHILLQINPNSSDAVHIVRVVILCSGTIHIFEDATEAVSSQLKYSCAEDVLREAVVQLGSVDLGSAVCREVLKVAEQKGYLGTALHLLDLCNTTLLRLRQIWHALLVAIHNYEPSIENMTSARRYRGLGTDVTKGFDLKVVDWEEILSKANEMTEIPNESDITPGILGKVLSDTVGLDELYINVVLGQAESGKVKYSRVEKKGIDALWVSSYYGRETNASISGLDKARSALFDSIDNYWVSVPTSKTLLVICKDPGTNINLNESLSKQKTQSKPADAARLVFLELASAIRPSALEKGKVSVSEVVREWNINDAVEGIIFKFGKLEEKIEENVRRDIVIWKRNPLRQTAIMKKVKETTSQILRQEDQSWLERELVATWGKLGMVKIPTCTQPIKEEEQHFFHFAQAHGPKKQHHLPFIIMDAPVPAAGVLATEVKDDSEIIVGLGGIQLERLSSYLGKPLYRMRDVEARRAKRKAPDVYMLGQGYIE